MSKKLTLQVASFSKADYAKADAVLAFLGTQCLPLLDKTGLPAAVKKVVIAAAKQEEGITAAGKLTCLLVPVGKKLTKLVLVGLGAEGTAAELRKAAGTAIRTLQEGRYATAVVVAPLLLDAGKAASLQAVLEGLELGNYEFNVYKSQAKRPEPLTVTVLTATKNSRRTLKEAQIIADSINYVRELVNEPGNILNPEVFAEEAKIVAKDYHLAIEVLDEHQLAHKHMGALLAVGQGSLHPSCMITLTYNGGGDKPFLALVGKGITFDSGGISLKPDDNMGEMKDDMTGAGDVLGAMRAIAALKLPVNVLGIMACAENMPGGSAQRPGDIVKSASGKTIEVISTDAEGRMVLADAVWYAGYLGAAKVVDIATLTGAVSVALGKETSAIISNDDQLAGAIKDSGARVGESWWQLPSLPDLAAAIKSDVADVKNSAGRPGGCITGGLFIGSFVKKDLPWAHLDIGGTSTAAKTSGHIVQGGTGFGTATLIELARSLA
jgi:leucyl aminopeptidase